MAIPQPEQILFNDYGEYTQDNHFDYDSGLLALPVAGSEPAVKVIRLHGGYGKRTLKFNETRLGRPPIVPTMTDTMNDTFLGGTLFTALPGAPSTSAGYTWHISGQYEYVQLTPRIVGEDTFPVGAYTGSMQSQDLAAYTDSGPSGVPPYAPMTLTAYNAFWDGFTTDIDIASGDWTWPYLAFPPVFSTDVTNPN